MITYELNIYDDGTAMIERIRNGNVVAWDYDTHEEAKGDMNALQVMYKNDPDVYFKN